MTYKIRVSISLIRWKQCLIYSHRRHYGFNICNCKEWWLDECLPRLKIWKLAWHYCERRNIWRYGTSMESIYHWEHFWISCLHLKEKQFICKFVYYLTPKSFPGLLNSFPGLLSLKTLFQTNDVLLDSIIQNPFLLLWRWL